MALPLLPAIIGALQATTRAGTAAVTGVGRSFGAGLAGGIAALGVHTLMMPTTRWGYYRANALAPNVMPPPEELMRLWYTGRIGRNHLQELLGRNGVWWRHDEDAATTANERAWHGIVDLAKPLVPWDILRRLWLLYGEPEGDERYSTEVLRDFLSRSGYTDLSDQNLFLYDTLTLGAAEALTLWRLGLWTREQTDLYLRSIGYVRDRERDALFLQSDTISPFDVLTLLNRGYYSEDTARLAMRAAGVTSTQQQEAYFQLKNQIPGPSDLILFGVREVWDPPTVERFGYDQEFPLPLAEWLGKQGLGWGEPVPLPDQPGRTVPFWPAAYWRSHWQLVSPQQAYEMFHRLRPGRLQRLRNLRDPQNNPLFPNLREFSAADLSQLLKVQDYPPPFRDQLAAINYLTLQKRDLQAGYFFNVLTRPEIVDALLDVGYAPYDAEKVASITVARADWQKNAWSTALFHGAQKQNVTVNLDAYQVGAQTRDATINALISTGVPENITDYLVTTREKTYPITLNLRTNIAAFDRLMRETLDLYEMGGMTDAEATANLSSLRISSVVQTTLLNEVRLRIRKTAVSAGIASLRSDYRAGLLSDQTAQQKLIGIGITPSRAALYTVQWRAGMSDLRRRLSTQQILNFFEQGLLTFGQAQQRLTNLGWSDPDTQLWLRAGQAKINANEAAALKAGQLAQSKAAAALLSLAKSQQKSQQEALKALRSKATPGVLARWLKDSLITAADMSEQLQLYGWSSDLAALKIADTLGVDLETAQAAIASGNGTTQTGQ